MELGRCTLVILQESKLNHETTWMWVWSMFKQRFYEDILSLYVTFSHHYILSFPSLGKSLGCDILIAPVWGWILLKMEVCEYESVKSVCMCKQYYWPELVWETQCHSGARVCFHGDHTRVVLFIRSVYALQTENMRECAGANPLIHTNVFLIPCTQPPPLWQHTSIVPFPPVMTQMTHDDWPPRLNL